MPTWKGMFTARRVPVTLCVLLAQVCALSAAGAAEPAASSSTAPPATPATAPPTTVPAPPGAFPLPTDFGLRLVQTQAKAKADMAAAKRALPAARKELAGAKKADVAARKELARLRAEAEETARRLERSRENLRIAAARAYMHSDSGQLGAALATLMSAKTATDAASQLHLITTYGAEEKDALDEYVELKGRLDRQVAVMTELRERTTRRLRAARELVTRLEQTIEDATRQMVETLTGIAEFQAAATSASSPILGPSRLAANQMADFVIAQGYRPRTTVPLLDLAQMYLDEGSKTGVRGDVAFAQAILETAGFLHNGSAPTDNNFAGIGWCDSCAHGYNFPDAQTGVRAQLQLLRIYVDPNFPDEGYTEPILLPGTLKLGFRGRVQTWWDLWGTWATGALYGQRVYDIYLRMLLFAASHPPLPPKPIGAPVSGDPGAITRPPGSGPGSKS
jgi:hypothetical protein